MKDNYWEKSSALQEQWPPREKTNSWKKAQRFRSGNRRGKGSY